MTRNAEKHLDNLYTKHVWLRTAEREIHEATNALIECFKGGGKVLACGNGGSAADSQHIVAELGKRFKKRRPGLPYEVGKRIKELFPVNFSYLFENIQMPFPAMSLTGDVSLLTAIANDTHYDFVFSQQVAAHGHAGDILIAFSTSGNSRNVLFAAMLARAQGLKVISFTGVSGGELWKVADIAIMPPVNETTDVQEAHLAIYHAICAAVEEEFCQQSR